MDDVTGADGEYDTADNGGEYGDESGLTGTGAAAAGVVSLGDVPDSSDPLEPLNAADVVAGDGWEWLTGTLMVTNGMCIVLAMASITGRVVSLATPNRAKIPWAIMEHTETQP